MDNGIPTDTRTTCDKLILLSFYESLVLYESHSHGIGFGHFGLLVFTPTKPNQTKRKWYNVTNSSTDLDQSKANTLCGNSCKTTKQGVYTYV